MYVLDAQLPLSGQNKYNNKIKKKKSLLHQVLLNLLSDFWTQDKTLNTNRSCTIIHNTYLIHLKGKSDYKYSVWKTFISPQNPN